MISRFVTLISPCNLQQVEILPNFIAENRFYPSMKGKILLIFLILGIVIPHVRAQEPDSCELKIGDAPWFSMPLPSAYEVITLDYPRPSLANVINQLAPGKGNDNYGWLDSCVYAGTMIWANNARDYCQAQVDLAQNKDRLSLYEGLVALQAEKYGEAAQKFARANSDSCAGTAENLRIIAAYLAKFDDGETYPLFPHFNGGFYSFAVDSLRGSVEEKSVQLGKLQEDLMQVIRVLGDDEPAMKEMLGDLLLNGPDEFVGKWMAGTAYLSIALAATGEDSIEFERKAIYCLESDRINPKYFNRYRFNKFRKGLQEDLDAAEARREAFQAKMGAVKSPKAADLAANYEGFPKETGPGMMLPEREGSPVVELIIREQERSMKATAGPNPNENPMNPDLDIKEIKTTASYNYYAIGLIALVIAAAVFMYIKVRNGQRERDGE